MLSEENENWTEGFKQGYKEGYGQGFQDGVKEVGRGGRAAYRGTVSLIVEKTSVELAAFLLELSVEEVEKILSSSEDS